MIWIYVVMMKVRVRSHFMVQHYIAFTAAHCSSV